MCRHLTGGYFADLKQKKMPDLANLGFPFADVFSDGRAVLGKVNGTGGHITLATVKEQLLYEVIDPSAYLTPDVSADFMSVRLDEIGPNQIQVTGGKGNAKPNNFKVSVGYHAGFVGEGEISYAGSDALERAQWAAEIIRERVKELVEDIRTDLIGWDSVHRENFQPERVPYEVRLRVAAKTKTLELAQRIGEEVEALYTNGPAGGGGVRKYAQEQIGIISVLLPRENCPHHIHILEA